MSRRPIIDAGPGLNFLSINKERLLIGTLGALSAPETVQNEVLRKATQDPRFKAAEKVWRKLSERWMQILPDDNTPELAAVVQRLTDLQMPDRMTQSKDLGETMVIAHAVVAAEAGEIVTVLIDDGKGALQATAEIKRLERMRAAGREVGSIRLIGTLTVLERAAGGKYLTDKAAMRDVYRRLRELDDGLPPIDSTHLLSPRLWN
ncbi:PIN domain-containing protein [Kribbella jiaozuonensis]|uniref:Uncharacterized protein n=1 Tax=Kribbella jiaozuonensis TaxID=2575441 RepID=A0A4V5UXM7_9ACTN|nr:hypothetical protein [Kribbella jiaozuonensis]TKK81513.1 hypothetical protein FDA38_01280 [Kribbella jiaozuonensis]